MPRRPIGDRAMTSGERSRDQRRRERERLDRLEAALRAIAASCPDPAAVALAALDPQDRPDPGEIMR